MPAFEIDHDRPNCIGCGACAAVAPEHWEMTAPDGKSDLIDSKSVTEGDVIVRENKDIEESDYSLNKEAADVCPVNVIHIINNKTGEKII